MNSFSNNRDNNKNSSINNNTHTDLHKKLADQRHVCVQSCVQLFVTPWTEARQAPLSMEVSRQEYWSGLPFPPPGDIPDPRIEPMTPACISCIEGGFFTTEPLGSEVVIMVNG